MVPKPKLTPEERKDLKKKKKLAKQQALEERKRELKRAHLSREIKYGILSKKKLDATWIQLKTEIALPALKQDLQLIAANVDLMITCKDFQISLLLDELDEAEEQYSYNFGAHITHMDNILDLYKQRLNKLKSEYDNEYSYKKLWAQKENELLQGQMSSNAEHLNTMMYRLDKENVYMNKVLRSEYLSKLNEELARNVHELGDMSFSLEKNFLNIWNSFNNTLRDYFDNTSDKRKECKALYKQDEFYTNLIKEQSVQLLNLKQSLGTLIDKQTYDTEDINKYIECKESERNFFSETIEMQREYLNKDIKCDNKHLTSLVVDSNDAIKTLEDQQNMCENVIKVYSMVRKLETQQEKILPYPKPARPEHWREIHQFEQAASQRGRFNVLNQTITKKLNLFWIRCGQGESKRQAIYETRTQLQIDNDLLKQRLGKYCSNTKSSCNDLFKVVYRAG